MDQRQQPGRVAKRKSDDLEYDDDLHDEMDDLQERLDRILGSDSGAESEYTPDKDSQAEDEEEVFKETKSKTDQMTQDDEDEDLMSDDSEIEKMKEDQRKRLEILNSQVPKPNRYEMKTPSPSPNSKSKQSENNILKYEDLRCVPSLVKECYGPLQKNIIFLAEKKDEVTASASSFIEKTHTEDIKKHLRKLMIEDPDECCATLIELMKQPKDLFLLKKNSSGEHYNYEMEALGKIALELIQRMLKNKTLQMETVLKIGLCGRSWRNESNSWKNPRVMMRNLGAWKKIPFTMTRAARTLLEGGDIARLSELFEVIL